MQSTDAKITVLITAYNAELTIKESVKSIIGQTQENIKILIIDDCSNDSTLEICKDLAADHQNIEIIQNSRNLGVGASRANGISQIKTPFIAIQDADDISLPQRLEAQLQLIESDSQIGVVGGSLIILHQNGKTKTRFYEKFDKELRAKIFRFNPVANPASMYRAEVFEKVGNFNIGLRVCEDLEFLFRLGTKYKFANLDFPILIYRQVENSLTRKKLKEMEITSISIKKEFSKSTIYNFSLSDKLFLFIQKKSMLMPTKIRLSLFSLIRGDKN